MSLSPIRGPAKRRQFLVYDGEWLPPKRADLETGIPQPLRPRLFGCFDGIEYRSYATIRDFLRTEMTKRNRGKWFYAHAGGLADVQFVLEEVVKDGRYSIEAAFSGSSAIIVHVRRGGDVWHFVDSFWTLRGKLADIGKTIGMPKGDVAWDAPIAELREYNEQDCRILWTALHMFEEFILGLGGQLQMTLASTSMTLFRRAFLTREIATVPALNRRSREAYHGGRVEVVQKFAVDGYYYDVNSCYPAAMLDPLPANYVGNRRRMPSDPTTPCVVHADVRVRDVALPSLPVRRGASVYFPRGSWTGWFVGEELRYAEEVGDAEVVRVHEVKVFDTFTDLGEFAQRLYESRMAATSDWEKYNFKILLNSAYGKFGERAEKETLWVNPPADVFAREDKRMLSPGMFLVPTVVDVPHEHVAVAAHVTARARVLLHGYMRRAMRGDHVVHYCDTDGFSTTRSDLPTDPRKLGALKLEKRYSCARFEEPKLYVIDGEVKAKGFPRRSDPETGKSSPLTVRDFEQILIGGRWVYERMPRVRESFAKGDLRPRSVMAHKTVRSSVRPKRQMYADGTTGPWDVAELDRPWLGDADDGVFDPYDELQFPHQDF